VADIIRCSGNGSAFQAGEDSAVFVRRSLTCGYESYYLSGKFFYCFWLQVVTYCYSGKGGAVD